MGFGFYRKNYVDQSPSSHYLGVKCTHTYVGMFSKSIFSKKKPYVKKFYSSFLPYFFMKNYPLLGYTTLSEGIPSVIAIIAQSG